MIGRLRWKNFMCYRGEHELVLDAKAYAIIARYEDNVERSNWGGKTALLRIIYFALYGTLGRSVGADGWITRGEKDGYVHLEFDDRSCIERERKRGSATEVKFRVPGKKPHEGDAAEREIMHKLGLSKEDFKASCYFEQRQMAQLILADPADRLDIISKWLGLGPIEKAEERSGEYASEHAREVEQLQRERDLNQRAIYHYGTFDTTDDLVKKIETEIAEFMASLPMLVTTHDTLQEERKKSRAKAQAKQTLDEYEIICKRGNEIKEELGDDTADDIAKAFKEATDARTTTQVTYQEAERDVVAKKRVALGLFDGKCPVAQIQCPATKQINADRKAGEKALATAEKKRDKAKESYNEANRMYSGVSIAKTQFERHSTEIESLRARGRALLPKVQEAREVMKKKLRTEAEIEAEMREVDEKRTRAHMMIERLKRDIESIRARQAEVEKLDAKIEQAMKKARIAAHGRKAFRALHRIVAEEALAQIGAMANRALITSSIDLTVDVRWEREGTSIAKTCDECGAAFPSSAKVKQCERCGAPRGMNLVNKLEFVLSDVSGAANDLAGGTLQLAAGAWLLRARESQWSAALIDEPFGQLDTFHKRALSRHLASMLASEYGYRQAFVIAHDTAVLDALPGRIEIIAGKNGSTVRVIA